MTIAEQNLSATILAGQTAILNIAGLAGNACQTALAVKFDKARSFISFNQRPALEQAFAFGLEPLPITGSPGRVPNRFMLMVGHTDQTGADSLNDPLSLRRAKAVRAVFIDDLDQAAKDWEQIYKDEHWNGPNFELAQMSSMVDPGGSSTTPATYAGDPVARFELFKRYLTALRPDWLAKEPRAVRPAVVSTPADAMLGCGSHHPAKDAPGKSQEENRRVEFFFFPAATASIDTCSAYPPRAVVCGNFISIVIELTDECGNPYSGSFDLTPPAGGVLRDQKTDATGKYQRENVQQGNFTVEVDGWKTSAKLTAAKNVLKATVLRPIRRSGKALSRGGQPFRFFGTNAYYLLELAGHGQATQVDAFFKFVKDAGIQVVRTWGFSEKQTNRQNSITLLEPKTPSVRPWINPNGIASLTTVVDAAEKHEVYLIITLGDYNRDYGGICEYARWAAGITPQITKENLKGDPDHLVEECFYTGSVKDPRFVSKFDARDMYIEYASRVINHFKDRSHILAFELLNEPRVKALGNGGRLAEIEGYLRDWIGHVASEIRSRCAHLAPPQVDQRAPFLSAGGPDINRLQFIFNSSDPKSQRVRDNIDLMDTHLYPELLDLDEKSAEKNLRAGATQAQALDMPFYLGEFGIAQKDPTTKPTPAGATPPRAPTKEEILRRTVRVSKEYYPWAQLVLDGGGSGMLFWQLLPVSTAFSRPPFDPYEVNVELAPSSVHQVQDAIPPPGGDFLHPVDGAAVAKFVNDQLKKGTSGGWSVC